jgi:hypothetical protein
MALHRSKPGARTCPPEPGSEADPGKVGPAADRLKTRFESVLRAKRRETRKQMAPEPLDKSQNAEGNGAPSPKRTPERRLPGRASPRKPTRISAIRRGIALRRLIEIPESPEANWKTFVAASADFRRNALKLLDSDSDIGTLLPFDLARCGAKRREPGSKWRRKPLIRLKTRKQMAPHRRSRRPSAARAVEPRRGSRLGSRRLQGLVEIPEARRQIGKHLWLRPLISVATL